MTAVILALLEEQNKAKNVQACLDQCGFKVFVVDTFVKAKIVLRTEKVDLIISDVHLENGGNVFDFLRWSKAVEPSSEIPFVLFSLEPTPIAKYLADGVRTAARMLGADRYIEMETFDARKFQEHINDLIPLSKV